jgi:hypothetical protein
MHRPLTLAALLATQITAAVAQSPPATDRVDLSLEQQAKVGEILTQDAGAPLPGGHFSLSIGNAVPAEVQLRPVPGRVDAVVPEFRGRSYVVVEEQVAVVDPQTRKILAVMQRVQDQTRGSAPPNIR